ncbi:MAG: FeoA family protein [Fimbriiglobus sp.]
MLMPLDMLRTGEWADIAEVTGDPAWVTRLAELGLREGSRLRMLQSGPTCLLQIDHCKLCLRGGDCSQILVRPLPVTA